MKVVIQRVCKACVSVDNQIVSSINNGILALIGLKADDDEEKFDYIIKKVLNLRIFGDEQKKMNKSLLDYNFEVLLVSQFTLYADCKRGNRPSFTRAMPPDQAKVLYQKFVEKFKEKYSKVKDGVFGAMMQINLINDGPVTIILEN